MRLARPRSCVNVAAPPGEGDRGPEGRSGREGVAADRYPVNRQTELLSHYVILGQFFASLSLSFLICKMGLILPSSHCLGGVVGDR